MFLSRSWVRMTPDLPIKSTKGIPAETSLPGQINLIIPSLPIQAPGMNNGLEDTVEVCVILALGKYCFFF